jgi:hypothetical protein
MTDRLEMPLEQFAQAVAKENARLNEEIQRLKEKCDRQAMILRRLTHFPDTYFIHADGGNKDINGMPERIYVVPAYGVDWSQVYVRTDKVTGPEW